MDKLITLRFPGKCVRCSKAIASGERAVWLGRGKGVRHTQCENPTPTKVATPIERTGKIDRHTIDYPTLIEKWNRWLEKPQDFYKATGPNKGDHRGLHESQSRQNWAGCSFAEINDWIANGYRVPGLDEVSSLVPTKPRRRLRYSEEGDELNLDLVWSGSDEPFSEWEKRSGKPGLSVEIHTSFYFGVSASTITAYQRWIARALQTLDENGVDMEINVVTVTDDRNGNKLETLTRVRKPGEASDYANWSAMFSPGGFRMLGILGIGIHFDERGKEIPFGYGGSGPYGSWEVAYDEDRNILVIGNDENEPTFPEMEMTEKLVAVLNILTG